MRAAKDGHPRVLVNLCNTIKTKVLMDDQDRTMLHWASANGHEKCVRVLTSMGADVRYRDAVRRRDATAASCC